MNLSVSKYLCPFCGEWHDEHDREFEAHFPTQAEQEMLMNRQKLDIEETVGRG